MSVFQKEKRKDFIKDNDSEYSKLYISRDKGGNARGLLYIDILELLKNESALFPIFYGKTYDPLAEDVEKTTTMSEIESLLEKCPILELKLYRDRVKKKVLNTRYEKFLNDEIYEEPSQLIATISDINDVVGSAAQSAEISEISGLPGSGLIKRYFQFVDKGVKSKSTGLYRYRIELRVKDGSYKMLYTLFHFLSQVKVMLNDYYDLSVSSYTPQETAGFHFNNTLVPEEYKKAPFKRYFSQGAFAYPDFYDAALEKFPPLSATGGFLTQPWLVAPFALQTVQNTLGLFPNVYIPGFGLLSDIITKAPVMNMLDPQNGTPHGIELFGRIFDSCIKKIESLLSGTKVNKTGNEITQYSLPNGYSVQNQFDIVVSPADSTIVESHTYDSPEELFEATENKNVYSDYLSIGSPLPEVFSGLRSLSVGYYKDRCWLETAKLSPVAKTFEGFTGATSFGEIGLINPAPSENTLAFVSDTFDKQAYSYLAPSIVELSDPLDNTAVYNFYYTAFNNTARQNLGEADAHIHSFNFYNWRNYNELFVSLLNYSQKKKENTNADLTNRYVGADISSNQQAYGVTGIVVGAQREKEPFKRLFEGLGITMHHANKHDDFYNKRPGPSFPNITPEEKEFPLKSKNYSDFLLQPTEFCKSFLYSSQQNIFSVDMSPAGAPQNTFTPPSLEKANKVKNLPNSHKIQGLSQIYFALKNKALLHEELIAPYAATGKDMTYYNPFFFFQNDLLARVEVFTGTVGNAKNDDNSWRLLTITDLTLDNNKRLFCRMRLYDEKNNKEINLPIIDKYFLIYNNATVDIPEYIPVTKLESVAGDLVKPIREDPEQVQRNIKTDAKQDQNMKELRIWENSNYKAVNEYRTNTQNIYEARLKSKVEMPAQADIPTKTKNNVVISVPPIGGGTAGYN